MSHSNLWASISRGLCLTLALCAFSLHSQAQNQAPDDVDTHVAAPSDNASAAVSDAVEMLVGPAVATASISVQLNGIANDSYLVGIRRPDASLIHQAMVNFENGVPRVIDIEKVETGILTLFVVVDGRELTDTFVKVD